MTLPALLAAASVLLLAHGDATWVQQNPRYLDRNGIHCCGVTDCGVAPIGSIVRIDGGWLIKATGRVFRDGDPDLYQAIDHQMWLCQRTGNERCLFVPEARG